MVPVSGILTSKGTQEESCGSIIFCEGSGGSDLPQHQTAWAGDGWIARYTFRSWFGPKEESYGRSDTCKRLSSWEGKGERGRGAHRWSR